MDPNCLFCLSQLNVGAVQESEQPNRSFRGCLENLLYNKLNLIQLAKRGAQQVSVVVSTPEDTRTHEETLHSLKT